MLFFFHLESFEWTHQCRLWMSGQVIEPSYQYLSLLSLRTWRKKTFLLVAQWRLLWGSLEEGGDVGVCCAWKHTMQSVDGHQLFIFCLRAHHCHWVYTCCAKKNRWDWCCALLLQRMVWLLIICWLCLRMLTTSTMHPSKEIRLQMWSWTELQNGVAVDHVGACPERTRWMISTRHHFFPTGLQPLTAPASRFSNFESERRETPWINHNNSWYSSYNMISRWQSTRWAETIKYHILMMWQENAVLQ